MLSHQDYLKLIEKSTLTAVDVIFHYDNKILLAFTEKRTKDDIDKLIKFLKSYD